MAAGGHSARSAPASPTVTADPAGPARIGTGRPHRVSVGACAPGMLAVVIAHGPSR